ncbi:hypothetical protein [Halarchaeum acidiphilum]|nr:hypothetical protein [Halarchaeum acidiphilum]
MDEEQIEAISRALRSDEYRSRGIKLISKVEPLSKELADAWADDVAFALRDESSAYTQYQLLEQLSRIARRSPRSVVPIVPVIVSHVADGLENTGSDDPDGNAKVRYGTTILRAVVDGTGPEEGTFDVKRTDVDAFFQWGGSEHRSLAYRLLGRSASPDSVSELVHDVSYEFEGVIDARRAALEDAGRLVLASTKGQGPLSSADTVVSFAKLYAHESLEPDVEVRQHVVDLLFEALADARSDERADLLTAVERLSRTDPDFAKSITRRACEYAGGDYLQQDDGWHVLQRVAEGAPEVIADRSEWLASEASPDGAYSIRALEVVSTVADRLSTVPPVLAETAIRALDSGDKHVVIAAIDAIVSMGIHPPPPKLAELDDGNTDVAKAASDARRRLSKMGGTESSHITDALRDDPRIGFFAEDGESDLYLKRRTDGGIWEDLSLGDVRRGVVEETVQAVERGENVPVVLPYYRPHDVVLVGVVLELADPGVNRQIGLYTPGSRTQWGMKGQVREELARFGLSDVSGDVVSATPIPDVVPHAYVWEGEVREDSDGTAPGRFVVCKQLHDFEEVGDLDIAVLNMTARTREDTAARIQDVEESHPDATLVNAYSYYTKNEIEGRPPYGPPTGLEDASTLPSVATLDPVVERGPLPAQTRSGRDTDDANTEESASASTLTERAWTGGDDDVRALATPATVKIDHVEADDVSTLLDQVFEQSAELRGVDDGGAGGLIFSRQLFFERLPVPTADFDEWVRERYYDGERFLPPIIQERIDDVENLANSIEQLQAVRPLNKSAQILERIDERLRDQNPLFDRLSHYVRGALETGRRLLVFSESVKHAEVLRYSLEEHDVVSREELESGPVSVVSPDTARDVGPHDTLLVFGALHQENAGFYVHPRVSETVVLTYDRAWSSMVERQASEFVETLNDVVGGSDYAPYPDPQVVGDVEPETEEIPESASAAESVPPATERSGERESSGGASRSQTGSKSKAEILEDAMDSMSTREYREESGRYEREVRHYLVKTGDGEMFDLTNHDTVLRQRTTGGRKQYHWVGPDRLTSGDTFVTIPDEIQEEIWRDQLRDFYKDEVNADEAVDRLKEWVDALNEAWVRVEEELSTGVLPTQKAVHGEIYQRLTEANDSFDRAPGTLKDWFDSVREADGPVDLVEDPSLTIGPRSFRDIQAVGRTFGFATLVDDAKEIEAAMEGLRTINRQQGRELHTEIREQMNTGIDNRIANAARRHVVRDIEEVDEESE